MPSTRSLKMTLTPAAFMMASVFSHILGFTPREVLNRWGPLWMSVTSLPVTTSVSSPASSHPTGPPPTMVILLAFLMASFTRAR